MRHLSHPNIPGLEYQKDLGYGGFADVYLFRRLSPDRLVAVKVLRTTDMSDRLAKRFEAEANAMAALNHPHIAPVYSAGFTTDGRPYIEMAYYPAGSLDDRVSQATLSVSEVLRIGVLLCSAIETAHSLDPPLLHRDIKPANVLIDAYGDPMLTDFGIASRMYDQDDEDSSLSVFWAPPEAMFSTSPIDKRSDVYSLGAMMWHLLVGRAPFVMPGGDNRQNATMRRTRDLPAPPTKRPDVPASLERLLHQTLSKDPKLRPASAAALARALNTIEQHEYGFGRVTPFKMKMDPVTPPPRTENRAASRTVARGPKEAPAAGRAAVTDVPKVTPAVEQAVARDVPKEAPAQRAAERTAPKAIQGKRFAALTGPRRGVRAMTPVDEPLVEDGFAVAEPKDEHLADHGGKPGLIVAISLAVVIVVGAIIWGASSSQAPATPSTAVSHAGTAGIGADLPPGPVTITCGRLANNEIDCEWRYSNGLTTDAYKVRLPDGSEVASSEPNYRTYAPDASQYCISVKVVRQDGRFPGGWSEEGCA